MECEIDNFLIRAHPLSLCFPHTYVQVNKNTGFFNGLYTAPELDAKSIQVHLNGQQYLYVDVTVYR